MHVQSCHGSVGGKTASRPRTISLGGRPRHWHRARAWQALIKLVLLQQLFLQQQLLAALFPLLSSALPPSILPGLNASGCGCWGEARSLSIMPNYTCQLNPETEKLLLEKLEEDENLADEDPPKASVPLATPLLTSPLLPPTLTMVTPALLFLPESSGFFSCGLKNKMYFPFRIRLPPNLSTRARSWTLRNSEMIFFDCEEAPSSRPRKTAFALKLDFLLGGFPMIAIERRVQDFVE